MSKLLGVDARTIWMTSPKFNEFFEGMTFEDMLVAYEHAKNVFPELRQDPFMYVHLLAFVLAVDNTITAAEAMKHATKFEEVVRKIASDGDFPRLQVPHG